MPRPDVPRRGRFPSTFMAINVLLASMIALTAAPIRTAAMPAQADSISQAGTYPDSISQAEAYRNPVVSELAERLGLTDEQANEIGSILRELDRRKQEIEKKYRGGDGTDRLSLMIEMRRLDRDIEERIDRVLDEGQMKAYQAYRDETESREQKKRVSEYASSNPHFEELVARLSLTDAQAADVYPILEEHGRQMRELMQGARGQGRQGMSAMRSRMEELDASTENRLSRILDERQMSEYRKYIEEQRAKTREGGREGMPDRDGRMPGGG
jgi:hypothetical protein